MVLGKGVYFKRIWGRKGKLLILLLDRNISKTCFAWRFHWLVQIQLLWKVLKMLDFFFFFSERSLVLKYGVELSVGTQDAYFSCFGAPKCSWDFLGLDFSLLSPLPSPGWPYRPYQLNIPEPSRNCVNLHILVNPRGVCGISGIYLFSHFGGREETKDLAVKAASTLPGFAVALQSECFVY